MTAIADARLELTLQLQELGLPLLYWVVFHFAGQAGVELPRGVFGTFRSYGPTLAAVVALAYVGGRPALRDLWSGVIKWRVSGRIYAIALLGPVAMMALAVSIVYLLEPDALVLGEVNYLKLVAILVILPFLDGPLGEEPGWRGYFLPALMARYNPLVASMLVGLVWYLWHLPHYHVDGRIADADFLWKYLLYTIALSFMHTWLYKKTRGSVLINVLFHNMANYVVLLSFTLFPALKDTQTDNQLYFIMILTLGALAAWSIRTER